MFYVNYTSKKLEKIKINPEEGKGSEGGKEGRKWVLGRNG